MNGSEGGIPFHAQWHPRVYHAPTNPAAPRPLCGAQAFTIFTMHDPERVTCQDCVRIRSAS